ncbi:MAG TPA: efflux RND transporter periplasmic adaptor subunit [Tepidisphaeraceae bacterium]|jgi:multidrug efflux system membrane fusion protein
MPAQLLLALAGCLIVAATGCEKEAPAAPPPPPKVSVAHPQDRSIVDHDEYNGWLDSPETVEVRARVRGHIDKVNFTDGQLVKKGDLLFELDPRPFQEAIDRATDQVGIYQAQLNFALVDEKRLKEMQKTQVASSIEVETAEAKARSLEAQVNAQKSEVERQKLDLVYSKVTAPISGRIGRALMTEGNLVNAGGSDPLLATITSVNPMYVYFSVDERALQRYKKERPTSAQQTGGVLKDLKIPFQFGLETDEGFPHEGTLDFADNTVNKETGTILGRGVVNNDKGLFVPGSRVRIRLAIGDAKQVLLVPDTAVLSDQDRKYVLVVDDKNMVQRRDINPGRVLDDGSRVVLPSENGKQGLTANDWIVVEGLQMARINYPVEAVKPSTTQPAPVAVLGQ